MRSRSPFSFPRGKLPLFLGLLLLSFVPATGRGQTPLPADDEVRQILRQRVDEEQRGVGIVVGLIDEHGKSRFVSYGATTPGGSPVDERTLFEIGSVTKVFTALLLELAVERGTMKLDDPVAKYLPPEMKVPTRGGRQITLLDLATQRSGLPRMPDNFHPKDPRNPYADYTADQLAQFLSGHVLTRDIGSKYEYSNLGFGVLGLAVTRAAGTDYETLVRREVCGPLGMPDTVIALTPALRERLAKPFDEGLAPTENWDLPTFAGAGALRSDAADLLRFVAANLGFVEYAGASALEAIRKPRADAGSPETRIGLAWNISERHGMTVVSHGGGTEGYRSFVALDTDRRRGVVALANSGNGVDDIALHLLDADFPLSKVAPGPAEPVEADPYVGDYAIAPEFVMHITRTGSRHFLQATGQGKAELFPKTPTLFFLKVVDAQISFADEKDGKYQAAVLHQNGLDQTAPRLDPSRPPPAVVARAAIALPPAVGDRYVGRYELAPGFVFTVTREENRYFAQLTGQGRAEIFPETEADFFYKIVDAQITFVTDGAGKVTSLILHQNGDHTAKRLP